MTQSNLVVSLTKYMPQRLFDANLEQPVVFVVILKGKNYKKCQSSTRTYHKTANRFQDDPIHTEIAIQKQHYIKSKLIKYYSSSLGTMYDTHQYYIKMTEQESGMLFCYKNKGT